MQASQSNIAADLPQSGSHSDSTFTRILTSPLSAPIQAARKYLERQRSDASQAIPGRDGTGTSGTGTNGTGTNGTGTNRTGTPGNGQASREQDRRLERSLYEGHSIEAGLSFEETDTEVRHGLAGDDRAYLAERAYLSDSDGSEALFPYAAAVPVPRPEVVRGAIFRLARESELARDAARDAESLAAAAPSDAEESARPLAFEDVARRVWRTDSADESGNERSTPAAAEAIQTVETGLHALRAPGLNQIPPQAFASREADTRPALAASPLASDSPLEEEPALAHDACNLLSALGLYGDLLSIPGVLPEEHRHYADELKLITKRSHTLIDRLLQVATAQKTETIVPIDASIGGPIGASIEDSIEDTSNTSHRQAGVQLASPEQQPPFAVPQSARCDRAAVAAEASVAAAQPDQTRKESAAAVPAAQAAKSDKPQSTSLVDLLMRWGQLLSTLAHGTLEVSFGPQAATPVPAGAEALERILVNLVRNARAATVAGGAIRISVGRAGDVDTSAGGEALATLQDQVGGAGTGQTMVLTVDDSGCGMTEAQVRRVLGNEAALDTQPAPVDEDSQEVTSDGYGRWPGNERHLQKPGDGTVAQTSTQPGQPQQTRRHGLGLRIVRELVTASGGTLSIQSWPGRGTRIEIRWPVAAFTPAARPVEPASLHAVESQELGSPELGSPELESPELENKERQAASEIKPNDSRESRPVIELRTATSRAPQEAGPGVKEVSAVGPDGFSEAQLRAMMLRLHRAAPPERTLPDKRPGDRRSFDTRPEDALQEQARQARQEVETAVDSGFGFPAAGVYGAQTNGTAQKSFAVKGAIAC